MADFDRWNNPIYRKKRLRFTTPQFNSYQPEEVPIYPVEVPDNDLELYYPKPKRTTDDGNGNQSEVNAEMIVLVSPEAVKEGSNVPLVFTVILTDENTVPINVIEEDLLVDFVIKGSAKYGIDYELAGSNTSTVSFEGNGSTGTRGTVVIPIGKSHADIQFISIADEDSEGDETIIVALTPNPTYVINKAFSSAKGIISEDSLIIKLEAISPVTSADYPNDVVIDEGNESPLVYRFTPLQNISSTYTNSAIIVRFLLGGVAQIEVDYNLPVYDDPLSGVYPTLVTNYPIEYVIEKLNEPAVTYHGTFTHKGTIQIPSGYLTQDGKTEAQLAINLNLYALADEEAEEAESISIAMMMSRQYYRQPLDAVVSYIVDMIANNYKFKVLVSSGQLTVEGFDNDLTLLNSSGYSQVGLVNTGDGYIAIGNSGNHYLFDVDGTQLDILLTVDDFSDGVIPDFYWKGVDLLMAEAKEITDPRFDISNTDISDNQFVLTPSYNSSIYACDPLIEYGSNAPTSWRTSGFSTTQETIGLGNKSFNYGFFLYGLTIGGLVRITDQVTLESMIGVITSYSSSFIQVTITSVSGSALSNQWHLETPIPSNSISRDTSQRAYSCTLNEIFLELFYLLPYRQNNLPEKFSSSTHWINTELTIPSPYVGTSWTDNWYNPDLTTIYTENLGESSHIVWTSSLPDPMVESSLDITQTFTKDITVKNGQVLITVPGQRFRFQNTYEYNIIIESLNKTVVRQDDMTIPYDSTLLQLSGLTTTSGNIVVTLDITMNKDKDCTSTGQHTPANGGWNSPAPIPYTTTYVWAETLSIINGTSSLSLTDCYLDITDFPTPVIYTSNTVINNDSSSEGLNRNINIDHSFVNSKAYDIPSVVLKGINCLLTKHIVLDIEFNNTINSTNWSGFNDNSNFSYTRVKQYNTPPSKSYKLSLRSPINTVVEIVFNKSQSNFILETDGTNLAAIDSNSTSITIDTPINEIGSSWLFDYRVNLYPSVTTLDLDTPTYFSVSTLGGTIYGFPVIPNDDVLFSQRIFVSPSIGTTLVALHCFNPSLDIADYTAELYFTVESLPANSAPFGTDLSTYPHTRAAYGGRTITTNCPSYPDNGNDPTVTLDGLPMLYSATITNTEYNGIELDKLQGVESTNVEVYVIKDGQTKRYEGVTSNYDWVEKADYCEVHDYLWFCNQKEVELQSVDLAIDYGSETVIDFYCWANVYTNAAIVISEGNHTTSLLRYLNSDTNKRNVNFYLDDSGSPRIAISKTPIVDAETTTQLVDLYGFSNNFLVLTSDSVHPLEYCSNGSWKDYADGKQVTIPTSGKIWVRTLNAGNPDIVSLTVTHPTGLTYTAESTRDVTGTLYTVDYVGDDSIADPDSDPAVQAYTPNLFVAEDSVYVMFEVISVATIDLSIAQTIDLQDGGFQRIGNDSSSLSPLTNGSDFISYHP